MIICTVTKKERIEKHLLKDYPYPKWPIPKRTRIRIKWCERLTRNSQWSGQSGATILQVRKLLLDIIYSPPTPAYHSILRKWAEVNQRWSINYYLSTSMYTKRCWLTHRVISPSGHHHHLCRAIGRRGCVNAIPGIIESHLGKSSVHPSRPEPTATAQLQTTPQYPQYVLLHIKWIILYDLITGTVQNSMNDKGYTRS